MGQPHEMARLKDVMLHTQASTRSIREKSLDLSKCYAELPCRALSCFCSSPDGTAAMSGETTSVLAGAVDGAGRPFKTIGFAKPRGLGGLFKVVGFSKPGGVAKTDGLGQTTSKTTIVSRIG